MVSISLSIGIPACIFMMTVAGSAAIRGCVITNVGQDRDRGGSGWVRHNPTGAGSFRGTGGDQAVVVSSVTGMTTQGGQECQGWPRHEQRTRDSDNGHIVWQSVT